MEFRHQNVDAKYVCCYCYVTAHRSRIEVGNTQTHTHTALYVCIYFWISLYWKAEVLILTVLKAWSYCSFLSFPICNSFYWLCETAPPDSGGSGCDTPHWTVLIPSSSCLGPTLHARLFLLLPLPSGTSSAPHSGFAMSHCQQLCCLVEMPALPHSACDSWPRGVASSSLLVCSCSTCPAWPSFLSPQPATR